MNDDLISRQAVLDIIDKWYPQKTPRMIKMISELPSVNPQEPCGDAISLEAFKQVMWERDIAIGQLKELGYGFGQKIEPSGDLISRQAVLDIIHLFFTEEVDKIPTKKTKDGEVYIIRKCQPLFEMNKAICKRIKALPPVNPQEPKTVLEDIKAEIKEWYWQADKQAIAKDPCVVDAMIDLFIRTINAHISGEPQESEVNNG